MAGWCRAGVQGTRVCRLACWDWASRVIGACRRVTYGTGEGAGSWSTLPTHNFALVPQALSQMRRTVDAVTLSLHLALCQRNSVRRSHCADSSQQVRCSPACELSTSCMSSCSRWRDPHERGRTFVHRPASDSRTLHAPSCHQAFLTCLHESSDIPLQWMRANVWRSHGCVDRKCSGR